MSSITSLTYPVFPLFAVLQPCFVRYSTSNIQPQFHLSAFVLAVTVTSAQNTQDTMEPVTCFSLLGLIIMYVSVLPAYIYMYYVHVLMFVEVRRGLSISWNWIRGDCNLPYVCWEQTSMCLYPLNHPAAPLFYFVVCIMRKSVFQNLYTYFPLCFIMFFF